MSGISVRVPKAGQLGAMFGGFGKQLPDNLRTATAKARKLLVPRLTDYPPPPSGSRYRRTEALKRGWERASPIVGTQFELVNPVEHASLVQGDRQAWMHKGRWTPASQIAKEQEGAIVALYDEAVKDTVQ